MVAPALVSSCRPVGFSIVGEAAGTLDDGFLLGYCLMDWLPGCASVGGFARQKVSGVHLADRRDTTGHGKNPCPVARCIGTPGGPPAGPGDYRRPDSPIPVDAVLTEAATHQ